MICVAYCRVSTDKAGQLTSMDNQRKHYTELFKKEGYNPSNVGMLYKKDGTKEKLKGIFADEGVSATSLKSRQAFNTMMEYAKKKAFDVIYVKSVSRFSRSTVDGINMIKDLRALGIGVIFEDCGINSLDPRKDFEIELRLSLANDESRKKSENIKWGMTKLYEDGGWNGSAPFGYDVEKAFLKINPKEAKTIRTIFDLFVNNGDGVGKIARYLNENNMPTKKGIKWSQKQITDVLENPIYTGMQITHKTECVDINRKITVDIEKEEQIPHHFEHLRIIDDELFRLAQLERQRRHEMFNRHTGHSNKHLLSSLLYCSNCGGNYKRKKRHSYRRKDGTQLDIGYEWTCAINDMYGKSRCDHRNAVIETEIIGQIKQEIIRLKGSNMDSLFELYLKVKFDYDVTQTHYDDLAKLKNRVMDAIEQLRFDKIDGIVDDEHYKEQMKSLNEKAVGINAEMSRIEKHDFELEDARLKYKLFMEYIKTIDVDNLTNAGLKKIFSDIQIKDVTLKNSNKKIICPIFNYCCLDMTEKEIIKKAEEMGVWIRQRVI